MVVAVLVRLLAPSSRGLERSGLYFPNNRQWAPKSNVNDNYLPTQKKAGHRRKQFKAVALLTSLASDFDVISDWLFYTETLRNDQEYRSTRKEGDGSLPYLIPPLLIWTTGLVCILGTAIWLILATDGRVISPLLRRLGYDKLSIGHMLFLSVLVEDFPQVLLTFLIENCYENNRLSNLAVVNVTVSLYDTLIKLAESYDERHDVVETGGWCKESLWAHKDVVTSVVTLPLSRPASASDDGLLMAKPSSRSTKTFQNSPFPRRTLPGRVEANIAPESIVHRSTLPERSNTGRRASSILENTLMPIAPMQLPRVRFLTASMDKTIRLWDTSATMKGHRREKCVRVFRGHLSGVTCISLFENLELQSEAKDVDSFQEETDHAHYFLSGCKMGDVKLWNLRGDCLRTYVSTLPRSGATAISSVKPGSMFIVSYQDGSTRLWEVWSGVCLGHYRGHSEAVSCVCSMQDSRMFVSGSKDTTLKLWDMSTALDAFYTYNTPSGNVIDREAVHRAQVTFDQPVYEERICARTFVNESQPSEILCVACIEKSSAFVAGSADGLIRLWAVDTGLCLRILEGHGGPVTAVEVVDRVTILTGSTDTHVKVWDAVSGICLRTYSDHSDYVTSLSVADDDQTFLSTSADLTVKIWVITSVPNYDPEEMENSILDINDTACSVYLPHS